MTSSHHLHCFKKLALRYGRGATISLVEKLHASGMCAFVRSCCLLHTKACLCVGTPVAPLVRMHVACAEPGTNNQQLSDDAGSCRTQKVLFPANTVMNLLQDLVTREPRLAAKLTTHHQPVAPTSCTAGELPQLPCSTCSMIFTIPTCSTVFTTPTCWLCLLFTPDIAHP